MQSFESRKNHAFFEELIDKLAVENSIKEKLRDIISEVSMFCDYPISLKLLGDAKELFPDYFHFELIKYDEARSLIDNFSNNYRGFITGEVENEYLDTGVYEEPRKELLLIKFISIIIDNYKEIYPIMNESFNLDQSFKKTFSIEAIIKQLLKRPTDQAIKLEMLFQGINADPSEAYSSINSRFFYVFQNLKN